MDKIKTPTLIVNSSICRNNIKIMAEKCRKSNVEFRPHFKTHQSLEVGKWFKDEGVNKIAVSSLEMAHFFADDGWKDIMVAFPINIREIESLNKLTEKSNVSILLAGNEPLPILTKKMKKEMGFFIKIDVGTKRCGFEPDSIVKIEETLELAKMNKKLKFMGFVTHAGNLYNVKSVESIPDKYKKTVKKLQELKKYFDRTYSDLIISWGDTPSCSVLDNFYDIDEARPGNFVYYDLMQLKSGVCNKESIAAVVAAPIVAKYVDRYEIVVYGGAVHLSKEYVNFEGQPAWGMVVFLSNNGWKFPDKQMYVRNIYQEHGIIKLEYDDFFSVEVGDIIGIIPVHACLTASHLKNNYYYI